MRFSVPHDHPSLSGHFPGRPIVPGVVVLDEAIALILRERPPNRLVGLDEVKLRGPVLPGDEVFVDCRKSAPGQLVFTCAVAGHVVLHGRARLGAIE